MIKYIFSDIDGVLTDGSVTLKINGDEQKKICYYDLDSINYGRKNNLDFAFITGEDTKLARYISERFNVKYSIYGAKDKEKAFIKLKENLKLSDEEICYIGDSIRDIPAIKLAKIGVSPISALKKVRECSDYITESRGGYGVLWETVEMVIKYNKDLKEGIK